MCSVLFCSWSFSVQGLTASCTTIFLRCLSSTVLNSSSIVSPVESLILPNQFSFGLPLERTPGVVPWIISFSRHSSFFFIMCPKNLNFLLFTDLSRCLLSVPADWSTHSCVYFSVHEICSTNLRHFISKEFILVSFAFLRVQLSHPCVTTFLAYSLIKCLKLRSLLALPDPHMILMWYRYKRNSFIPGRPFSCSAGL